MPAHGALDGDISGQPVAVGLGQVVERRIAVAQNPFHTFVVGRPRELPGVGAEDVDGAGDDREPQQASVRAPAAPFAEQVQLIPRPQRIGVALQRALHAEVLLVVDHVAGIQPQKIVEELVGVHDAFVVAYPVRLEGIAGRGARTDREAPHGVGLGGDHHVIGGSVEVDVFAARIGGGQQVVAFLDESPDHRGVVEQVPVRIMAVGHWVEEVGTPCEREGGGQDDQQFFHGLVRLKGEFESSGEGPVERIGRDARIDVLGIHVLDAADRAEVRAAQEDAQPLDGRPAAEAHVVA